MAPNRSQAKHAKALRRKKQMVERSRNMPTGASSSTAERACRAAATPLHCCLVQDVDEFDDVDDSDTYDPDATPDSAYEAALDELTESAWRAACQDDKDD
jgi:hypothetical protein